MREQKKKRRKQEETKRGNKERNEESLIMFQLPKKPIKHKKASVNICTYVNCKVGVHQKYTYKQLSLKVITSDYVTVQTHEII